MHVYYRYHNRLDCLESFTQATTTAHSLPELSLATHRNAVDAMHNYDALCMGVWERTESKDRIKAVCTC